MTRSQTMTRAILIVVVSLVCAVAAPAVTNAKPRGDIGKRVDAHLRQGLVFFSEKQYELAIVEFRAGYALDPRPDFLFALAQAERLSGDCPSAVVYYRRYLQTKPGVNQSEAARVNMKRCGRALESAPKSERGPDAGKVAKVDEPEVAKKSTNPAPLAASVSAVKDPRRPARSGWYRDTITLSLLGGTALALGVGSGFWLAKSGAESAAASASNDVDYNNNLARARSHRTRSLIGLSIGVALAAGTTYRALRTRRTRERRTTVVVAPSAGGGSMVLSGRF